MAQQLNLGHALPCKPEPLIVYSHDSTSLYGTSASAHTGVKSDKGDSATSDLALHALGDCPDGGLRAWLVVFGGSCANFATAGCVVSWGVFQDYYQNVLLKGTSPSTIAWIGSMQFTLFLLPALISGRLFDLGYFRSTLIVASVNLVVCTVLVAECHEFWQLLLCQGFGVGMSCGLVFGPVMSVMAHWFKRRLSTALGVITFAASIGGMVFPIVFRNLLITVGFKWTMRIMTSILALAMGITNLTIRRRFPPTMVSGGLFNAKQFRSPAYTVYTVSGLVILLGVYTVVTFIDVSAPSQDVPESFSSYLVSIANAGNAVGRLSGGLLADKFGPLNVMIPASLITGVLTIIWPHTRGIAALVTVALTYGASSGAIIALLSAPMMALGESADVGRRTGMFFTVGSLGSLAGPPISGAINHATGGYIAVGVFDGCSLVVAVFLLAITRYFVLGGWRGKA